MNIFKQMGCAVAKVSAYPRFLENRKGKTFGYGLLLITLYFVIAYLIPVVSVQREIGKIADAIEKLVPNFELEDGELWMEEPMALDVEGVYVDVDTQALFQVETAKDFSEDYEGALIADAKKVFVKVRDTTELFYFADVEDWHVGKEMILDFVPIINAGIFVILLFMYIGQALLFFFGVLLVTWIGMAFSGIRGLQLDLGQVYTLSIYSRTLPLAVKAILRMTGLMFPGFWAVNFGVSVVYLSLALSYIKKERDERIQKEYEALNVPVWSEMGQQDAQEI
ncbi:MAG: DUF1189 domain-containing protein [Lachnospiraceae bacterium]|nr:DUF1189 domain-containing protein [Lachnospiraceae bacterium]